MSDVNLIDDLDQLLGEISDDDSKAKTPARIRRGRPAKISLDVAVEIDNFFKQHGFCGERVRIIIERSQNPQDQQTVFIRLNDYTAEIERGIPVEVPIEVIHEVLDNAVHTSFSQPSEGVMLPHNSPRFPYQRVS